MNSQTDILNAMKKELRLEGYTAGEPYIRRELTLRRETNYYLSAEWFPEGAHADEEELNPEGTVVIEYHMNSGTFTSFLTVGGCHFIKNPARLPSASVKEAAGWMEQKTGLIYEKEFILTQEKTDEDCIQYQFSKTHQGIPLFMQGLISLTLNKAGTIMSFQLEPGYPDPHLFAPSEADLNLNQEAFSNQLLLLPFPDSKNKAMVNVYTVEEVFLNAEGKPVFPYLTVESRMLGAFPDRVLRWTPTVQEREPDFLEEKGFEVNEPDWEDAVHNTPHPDCEPVTKEEVERTAEAVTRYMQSGRPVESGKWILRNVSRENGRLTAHVYPVRQTALFEKLIFFFDHSLHITQMFDTSMMNEGIRDFAPAPPPKKTKREAAEKIRPHLLIKPYWVWNSSEDRYEQLWMLDSKHIVLAATGEILHENALL